MPKPNDRLSEKTAESGIVAALAASPLYRERPAAAFDLATMLDAEELAAFVQTTQPKEWAKLARQFPGGEQATLAAQVSALVVKRGTLEVLRSGVSFNGINLQLAFFKPSAGGNPEHQERYAGNRFAIMRQIHFSTKTPDQSVDTRTPRALADSNSPSSRRRASSTDGNPASTLTTLTDMRGMLTGAWSHHANAKPKVVPGQKPR